MTCLPIGEYPDLSTFETEITPYKFEEDGSSKSYVFSGRHNELSFEVDVHIGYDRPVGLEVDEKIIEPDILYISDFSVSEGHRLGSAVMASLVDYAKGQGFHAARMGIINPRIIGVVSKLQSLGIIQASYFRLEYGEHIRPMPATADIPNEADVLSAEEASTVFTPISAEIDRRAWTDEEISDTFASVDCAIFF
jgi:hypothetical protein